MIATAQIMQGYSEIFENKKRAILCAENHIDVTGNTYYVSNDGNDKNDGKTPLTAWKSLQRVSDAKLLSGDAVLFRRGDLFRGSIKSKSGVTYSAYGAGEKPRLYGSEFSLADSVLWEEYDKEHHIWKCTKRVLDSGTLVFNNGEAYSIKLIPSYINGKFVCRDDEAMLFDICKEMTRDLDMYWDFQGDFTYKPSKGEDFPIPDMNGALGDLYLRCDRGNPGNIFESVESLSRVHMFVVGDNENVTIDNLCIKYVGMHGISAKGHSVGLHVTNCEFGWLGGAIQHYFGTDPNYPQGGRGTVTRFGNAVEVYGGCEDYTVSNNYIYQVYDAGITHQVTTAKKVTMSNIRYADNVIERCVYGIEYFLDQVGGENESYMDNVVIEGNFIRLSGYGWGQQRHNKETPAHIKGWSYVNTAHNFKIENNIFGRSAYRMLHLVARKDEYCPRLSGNTFIQTKGGILGQYGGNQHFEPKILMFDADAEVKIKNIFVDSSATVIEIKEEKA